MGILLLGIVLILVGWVTAIPILYLLGVALVILGLILMIIPGVPGRPVGRSRYRNWY